MTPEARMQTAQEVLDQLQKLLKKYLADAQKTSIQTNGSKTATPS